MSTQFTLPKQLWGLSPVELEARYSLQRGDVEHVLTSPGSCVATLKDSVTLPLSTKTDADTSIFALLTPAQAVTWIENNVTSLATAKTALQRLAEFCIYLRDRD